MRRNTQWYSWAHLPVFIPWTLQALEKFLKAKTKPEVNQGLSQNLLWAWTKGNLGPQEERKMMMRLEVEVRPVKTTGHQQVDTEMTREGFLEHLEDIAQRCFQHLSIKGISERQNSLCLKAAVTLGHSLPVHSCTHWFYSFIHSVNKLWPCVTWQAMTGCGWQSTEQNREESRPSRSLHSSEDEGKMEEKSTGYW